MRVGEGVYPVRDARLHVIEHRIRANHAHQHQQKADDEVELLSRGDVEHGKEHEEEHERASQVFLESDDKQRDDPHEKQWRQRADVGQLQRPEPPGEYREHLAVGGKVAADEQHDDDLGDFARLEGERPDGQPDPAPVMLYAYDRQQRRQEKHEAEHHERVLVIRELVELARERKGGNHGKHADEQPDNLVHGKVRRKPRDERDANAR